MNCDFDRHQSKLIHFTAFLKLVRNGDSRFTSNTIAFMKNTLVWQMMISFSTSELREAGQFVRTPLMNKRKDLPQLYDYLAKAIKELKDLPSQEVVYKELFPDKTFDNQHMRLLLSYLFKLLEQYLIWKESKVQTLGQYSLLLAAYRKRKLTAHFQKALRRSQKRLDGQAYSHPEKFLEQYLVEYEHYLFLSESGRTKELNLQAVEDNLSAAMFGLKLKQACFLRAHEAVFNTNYEITLIDEILEATKSPRFNSEPAVALYRSCYVALFQKSREGGFLLFKTNLLENTNRFPKEEMRDLYLLAINFCIKKVNEGQSEFYREALDLYKSGLETELLLKEGILSRFTYNNIVAVAIRIETEWPWASQFVIDYKPYLETTYQEAAFGLNAARLAFVKKDYNNALGHLQQVDYKDLINNMVAKVIQMKIYFEMEELELLYSHLRTMRMFIRRNKKMAYHRENWSNIVRYTQKLTELNPFDHKRKAQLAQQIASEATLTEKEWLLDQIAGK